ncbi:MAG: succinyl-diaminopimelate desuccinylase [Methylovirgula sp.]
MQSALELAQALIRCPSVTPKEAGALALLEGLLRALGFATHRVTFSEEGTPDVENLYARIGSGAPHFVFAGHTDVVPAGERADWRFDPFKGEVDDGMIWGRGASDMKSAIAAFVAAAAAYIEDHQPLKGSIGLLLTGDEEGPAVNGTVKLLAWATARGEKFDQCLVGEPTSAERLGDRLKIGRRGSLTARLVVHGRQGHVAYPRRAENPIPPLIRMLDALNAAPLDAGTAHFEPSNLEIVTIDVANAAANVIPNTARARFNVRFNDTWTPQTLEAEIARRCAGAARGVRYHLSFEPCNAVAFVTAPDRFTELVAQAIAARTGSRPDLSTSGGTSDARFIRAHCPVVEFGPLGATAHMVDEHIAVSEIATLTDIYRDILERYFSNG